MPDYPNKLPGFVFPEPHDKADVKLLADIHNYGWHVVGIPDDQEGPGFAFTVGLYVRSLQPEILMMGIPIEPSHRVLNAVAQYLLAGGTLVPERRCSGFVDGREVLFRRIHQSQLREYLGCANWFYRPLGSPFPAFQCIWPDLQGRFPHETGFDTRFAGRQIDLSLPRG